MEKSAEMWSAKMPINDRFMLARDIKYPSSDRAVKQYRTFSGPLCDVATYVDLARKGSSANAACMYEVFYDPNTTSTYMYADIDRKYLPEELADPMFDIDARNLHTWTAAKSIAEETLSQLAGTNIVLVPGLNCQVGFIGLVKCSAVETVGGDHYPTIYNL